MTNTADCIRLSGKIEQEDFLRAVRLNLKPGLAIRSLGWVLLVLFLAVVARGGMQVIAGETGALDTLLVPSPIIFGALLFSVYFPFRARQVYRRQAILHAPFEIELSSEGLHWKNEFTDARLPWKLFRRVKEDRHTVLVYQGGGAFHAVPKRFLSAADAARVTALCRSWIESQR